MSFLPTLRAAIVPRAAPFWLRSASVPTTLRSYSTPSSSTPSSSSPSTSTSTETSTPESAPRSSLLDDVEADMNSYKGRLNTRSSRQSPSVSWQNVLLGSKTTSKAAPPPKDTTPTPEYLWSRSSPISYSPPVTTTSARSFAVKNGDVGRAYRVLNRVLRENNVRRELKRQERFEGPSDKRVRLNSERHRKRFKVAVGKAVGLAMRMKNL